MNRINELVLIFQAAISAEKTCLEEQVENLLTWLVDTEARMNGGMVGVDKREKADKDVHCEQLLQQLSLCKASWPNTKENVSFFKLLNLAISNTVHNIALTKEITGNCFW